MLSQPATAQKKPRVQGSAYSTLPSTFSHQLQYFKLPSPEQRMHSELGFGHSRPFYVGPPQV